MEINKQLFEDVLSGKLKGTFILKNGFTVKSNRLFCTRMPDTDYVYVLKGVCSYPYSCNGLVSPFLYNKGGFNIVNFIPETNMKENELTIEIPNGKVVDWNESKNQNKVVLKDKQLTYEDVCKKLLENNFYFIDDYGNIVGITCGYTVNCAKTEHQLKCILAKNMLANVATYLNDKWKPIHSTSVWIIEHNCHIGYHAVSIQAGSIAFNCYGLVIFKSKELAQQAIEILGEETVKLALEPLGI